MRNLPHSNEISSPSRYPIAAIHGHAPITRIPIIRFKFFVIGINSHLPSLAYDPPTIFVVLTFVDPQPSRGVSKRPLIGETGVDGIGIDGDCPNLRKIENLV